MALKYFIFALWAHLVAWWMGRIALEGKKSEWRLIKSACGKIIQSHKWTLNWIDKEPATEWTNKTLVKSAKKCLSIRVMKNSRQRFLDSKINFLVTSEFWFWIWILGLNTRFLDLNFGFLYKSLDFWFKFWIPVWKSGFVISILASWIKVWISDFNFEFLYKILDFWF